VKTKLHYTLTALLYFTIALARPAASAQQLVPFRLVHDTFAVVSVQVNGQGPFDFILDTGTDTTIVDRELAARLQLVPMDRLTLSTPGGKQILARSWVRRLVVGSATLSDVEVLLQDTSSLRQLDSRIRGILGLNFFSHFNFLLDYRRRSLRFEVANELRDSTQGEHVSLGATGGKMLVESEIRSGGETKALLLLDSGVNEMVLFRKGENLRRAPSNMQMTVGGPVAIPQSMSVGLIETLRIGKQEFRDLRFSFLRGRVDGRSADVYPGDFRAEDGLLPTVLFRALYVNNREGYVVFNPKFEKS
jgi:hypothetical protein